MDCMSFMESIPKVSCENEFLNGDNSVCRFKHSFMAQFRPDVHCPHMGRETYACSDVGCEELACGGTPGDIEFTGILPTECSEECMNERGRKVKSWKGLKGNKGSKTSNKGSTTSDDKVNTSRCASSW